MSFFQSSNTVIWRRQCHDLEPNRGGENEISYYELSNHFGAEKRVCVCVMCACVCLCVEVMRDVCVEGGG